MPSQRASEKAPRAVIEKIIRRCILTDSGCWQWPGATGNGYGRIYFNGRLHYVHRVMYGTIIEPIEPPLVIDHLCRNQLCCNPRHLEAVTDRENAKRGYRVDLKTHCAQGHDWTEENQYIRADGRKWCRVCQLRRMNERKRRLAS